MTDYTPIQQRVLDIHLDIHLAYVRCEIAYHAKNAEEYFLWRKIRQQYLEIRNDLYHCDSEFYRYDCLFTLDDPRYKQSLGDYIEMLHWDKEMRALL